MRERDWRQCTFIYLLTGHVVEFPKRANILPPKTIWNTRLTQPPAETSERTHGRTDDPEQHQCSRDDGLFTWKGWHPRIVQRSHFLLTNHSLFVHLTLFSFSQPKSKSQYRCITPTPVF